MDLNSSADSAKTYLRLSRDGRRLARHLRHQARRRHQPTFWSGPSRSRDRQEMLRFLVHCDLFFIGHIPESVCRTAGRNRSSVYSRFVPFAWLNLQVRCRLFDAFGLSHDPEAEERQVLFGFLLREWNDILDTASPADAFPLNKDPDKATPRLALMAHLLRLRDRFIPRERFPSYHRLVDNGPPIYDFSFTSERPEEFVARRSHYALLMSCYAMQDDLPVSFVEALKPFALWFYALDELADLDRDRQAGRPTLMGTVQAPETEIWRFFGDTETCFKQTARDPEKILPLMRFLTEETVKASRLGIDIESEVFGESNPDLNPASNPSKRKKASGT